MAKREKRRKVRLSSEDRREAIRLAAKGCTHRQIAEKLRCSRSWIQAILRPLGGVIRRELVLETPGRLSIEDRVEIRLGVGRRESYAQIGREIGFHRSTITREVNA